MKTWYLLPWEGEEAKSKSEKLLDEATTQDMMIWVQLPTPETLFVGCWKKAERRSTSSVLLCVLYSDTMQSTGAVSIS